MKKIILSAFILSLSANVALAAVEPNYAPDKPPVTTPWFATQGPAEQKADMDFIKGMHPHHAGALTMSEEYLRDKGASHGPLIALAKGIIHNQKFEMGMLNRVEQLVGKPINGEREWRQIAERGLAQKQRFTRAPMPSGFGNGVVSRRDVEFAKAMIVHHEGALMMCDDYLANPAASNKYLRLLCVDILTDQKMEIGFMKDVVAKYPGNPDDVKIDASMIHGMEGMEHHMHGVGPAPKKPKSAPKAKAPAAKKAPAAMDHSAHGAGHGSGHEGGHH